MEVLAIVPGRMGSKGVPKKNLLELGGKALLEIAVESALSSKLVTRVIVSTESEELARVGKEAGAQVPFIRPAELANDTASTWSVVQHALRELKELERYICDVTVILQPTTPFRTGAHIDAVISKLQEQGGAAALTVREVDYSPYWMFQLKEGGHIDKLFDEGFKITRRQDAPVVYQPNGAVYAVRSDQIEQPSFPWDDALGVPVSVEESLNIDHLWQYEFAKVIWEKNRNHEESST
ncbi:MAG: acylneuraminate cytidylyltransferase family protein [Verrucomicrobiota bacterium]